jgi:hypothetical protein
MRRSLAISLVGILLAGCSMVNSHPNEYGIQTKQDFSPVRVAGYIPGVGKAKPQEEGFLSKLFTLPYRRPRAGGYAPKE